jgi:exosortase/archaeosortase family protein
MKWGQLKALQHRSRHWEELVGGGLVLLDFLENLLAHSAIGLVDMLVIFAGLWISFYGFSAFRFFILPTLYIGILIAGYQIEYHIPSIANLEEFIAGLMASMMQAIGVKATLSGNIVSLYGSTPIFLQVDGPCTGLQGILAFGMLASMTVLDVKSRLRRTLPILAIGFAGAFLINFARLAMIFLSFEFLGVAIGEATHAYVGYLLFLAWVVVFWSFAFKYLTVRPPQSVHSIPKAQVKRIVS